MSKTHSPRGESARHLLFLYSVVCALSLETAIGELIEPHADSLPVDTSVLPLAVAFVVTLIPFYHGALRHLDDYYVLDAHPNVRRGALLVDFFALFVEAILLFALATLTPFANFFAATLITLLLVDVAWSSVTSTYCIGKRLTLHDMKRQAAQFAQSSIRGTRHSEAPQMAWLLNNVVWLLVLAITVAADQLFDLGTRLSWIVLAIALARTVSDYRVSWSFYFPD